MGKKKKRIATVVLIALVSLFFSGCSSPKKTQPQYKITLEVWGFDDADVFAETFSNYRKLNPAVTEINYKKQLLDVASYKENIIDALAAGQGPDIFLIHNSWLPLFKNKIAEAPADVLSEQKVKNNFVDVILSDFVDEGKTFALPLSVDTLALYYNKDLFNESGIVSPPSDWNAFVADAQKITKIDGTGQILRSGAAIGTASNINRATDILVALMIQNGTEMTDARKTKATFNSANLTDGSSSGDKVLEFYTSFAKTNSANYAWNSRMHYSLDAFSEGKLGMMLNYSWQRAAIMNKSPKLNFDVAPFPQVTGKPPVDYANYWGFAVTKNKPTSATTQGGSQAPTAVVSNETRIKEAWKLITYLTTKPEPNPNIITAKDADPSYDTGKKYMEKTANPAARRDLIEIQKNDAKVGVFASQNLIAKSWYQADAQAIESILAEAIEQAVGGQMSTAEALNSAAAKVSLIMKNK